MARSAQRDGLDGDIPRIIYSARILWLCLFPVFTVIAGNLVLLLVPQARETLLAFGDQAVPLEQGTWFYLAFLSWMLLAWYTARLLVSRRYTPDLVGRCTSTPFAKVLAAILPRALATLAAFPLALFLLWQGGQRTILGLLLLVSAAAVLYFLVYRRTLVKRLPKVFQDSMRYERRDSDQFDRFDSLSPLTVAVVVFGFLISFGLLFGLVLWREGLARSVGSPALVLFALASWTLFGGIVLTFLPKAVLSKPAWTWTPLLAVLLFASFNENHPVMKPALESQPPDTRRDLRETFQTWLRQRPDKRDPVIFVASAGGASRAAYWTTTTLGLLEDQARAQGQSLADHVFVISGISGGSVGAGAFVSALLTVRHGAGSDDRCRQVRQIGNAFTGRDHLATVVGFMLFPDLIQRLLPVPFDAFDRSLALEKVWERDWEGVAGPCRHGRPNPWSAPFIDLYAWPNGESAPPALTLSTTALARGQRVHQAHFTIQNTDAFDLLNTAYFATGGITLSQVAHNSARFPFVSPGGVVHCTDERVCDVWDRMGDGGYVEASGTLTLLEIIRHLMREGLIVDEPARENVESGEQIGASQVRVILIDNRPATEGDWLCTRMEGEPAAVPRNNPARGEGGAWLPDFTLPVAGAFATRGGRGATAEFELAAVVGGCGARLAELRLPRDPLEPEPSMNWMLNEASRTQMDRAAEGCAIHGTTSHENLKVNLDRVRGWLKLVPTAAPCPGGGAP